MNWPKDADGDVLRRLESRGFDFAKSYVIDFNVDFEEWPPASEALQLIRAQYPSTVVYQPEEGSPGYVQFQIYSPVTYDLVTRVQRETSDLMRRFGGVCESWGVMH